MRMKMNLWMLGIAAMLASCSNEDLLQSTNADSDVVHITAQLADGMKTRAVNEDDGESTGVDRYVLNAYEVGSDGVVSPQKADVVITDLGSGKFTAKLDRKKTYKFYCWADAGEESSYTIGADNDLTSITLNADAKPTIAHRGESGEVNGANDATVNIQMTHAVAKAVLQTTSDLAANTAKLSTETYNTYNAITGVASGDKIAIEGTNAAEATGATKENPVEVLQFYTLIGKKETLPAKISYTTDEAGNFDEANTYTHEFSNAPFQADYRTVFKGDIAGLQYSNASVTAALDGDWEDGYLQTYGAGVDKVNHSITTFKAGQLTTALIEQAVAGGTRITLTLSGLMDDTDAQALYDYFNGGNDTHVSTLDMSGVTGLTTIKTATFFDAAFLANVKLPASVTKIENYAFRGCAALETITAEKVTTVGSNAFCDCYGLNVLSLPSVTTLGNSSILEDCLGLTALKLTSPNFDGKFGDGCFKGVFTEHINLYVHEKLKSNVNKVSDPDGSVVYKFKNSQNGEYITFESITLVDDNGNVVPFE